MWDWGQRWYKFKVSAHKHKNVLADSGLCSIAASFRQRDYSDARNLWACDTHQSKSPWLTHHKYSHSANTNTVRTLTVIFSAVASSSRNLLNHPRTFLDISGFTDFFNNCFSSWNVSGYFHSRNYWTWLWMCQIICKMISSAQLRKRRATEEGSLSQDGQICNRCRNIYVKKVVGWLRCVLGMCLVCLSVCNHLA